MVDNDDGDACLTLDFGPFDAVHRWRKMSECDEFVGDRRSKQTVVTYQDSLYVFGGDNGKSMLNDLLRFDVKDKSWGRALAHGVPPAPRYHHSAVVHESSMFIFGGYTGDLYSNSNLTNRNDLWEYRFNTGQWAEWKFPAAAAGVRKPVPRSAHGAAVHDGRLVVFAGYDGNVRLNDMWQTNIGGDSGNERIWEEIEFCGESPPACCNFPVAVAQNSMFVFSGSSGANVTAANSLLFRYHFGSRTWTRVGTEHVLHGRCPSQPTRRYGHTMAAFHDRLYVFGGAADKTLPNELHCFDLDTRTWSLVDPAPDSEVPTGRLFHASAVVDDAMYVFGGTVGNNQSRSGEMFRFQMASFPKCTLHRDFGRLLRSGQFADVHFIVGGGGGCHLDVFPCHMTIVAARSEWLRTRIREVKSVRDSRLKQLSDKVADKDLPPLEVRISEAAAAADVSAFKLILDFIYTDEIDPTTGGGGGDGSGDVVLAMMNVYTLAVTFHMYRLEQLCVQYLESAVGLANVLAALRNASRLGLHFFKEFCMRFVVKESNYGHVVMSEEFETLDRSLMVQVVRMHTQTKAAAASRQSSDRPPDAVSPSTPSGAAVVGSILEEDMRRFLHSSAGQDFADVHLVLDGASIPAHKSVLAARSSYFEAIFRSFSPKDNVVTVAIGEMVPSRQSFNSLLRYIYYGDVKMPPEDSLYLFSAPSFYMFANNRLQAFCKHNLERNVTVDNVIQILEAADRSQTHDMKKHALNLIVRHFARVARLPHVTTLSKELLLDILQALAAGDEAGDRLSMTNDPSSYANRGVLDT